MGSLEASQLELKTTAVSGQDAVAACLSDVAIYNGAVQELQRTVNQLLQTFENAQHQSQLQVGSDSLFKELQVQVQQIQHSMEGIHQQHIRYAQLENEQNLLSHRLAEVEKSQLQIREHQHVLQDLHSHLTQQREQDRIDLQRLFEEKFGEISLRMTQFESRRESWTTIERLVSSGSSGNGNHSINQSLRSQGTVADSQCHNQDFSGSEEIAGSYIALQTSQIAAAAFADVDRRPTLQVVSVNVKFPHQDPQPLQLHARGGSVCPTDSDFSVSIGVNLLEIIDLQVFIHSIMFRLFLVDSARCRRLLLRTRVTGLFPKMSSFGLFHKAGVCPGLRHQCTCAVYQSSF